MHGQYAVAAWDGDREYRLTVCMLIAMLIVSGVLSLLRLPHSFAPSVSPIASLWVRIVSDSQAGDSEPAPQPTDEVDAAPEERAARRSDRTHAGDRTSVPDARRRDAEAAAAIRRSLDGRANPGAVNPLREKKRRDFAGRYRPPEREPPKPIWENAEKDQLGRTVLRSGNCYRVLDAPNVGSRDMFLEFGQYITVCEHQDRQPRRLPWVDGIRDRYAYLAYPDGYVPDDAGE